MASYGDFDTLVGALKRSAIDAWMRDEMQFPLDGDHYELSSSGDSFKVTRPDTNGKGGGDWEASDWSFAKLFGVDRDDEFTSGMDGVRQKIDDLVNPWRNLPDPTEVGVIVESCRQMTRRLSGAAASDGGVASGAGDLASYLKLVEQNASAMSGETIAAYKAKFLVQLGQAIGGFHAISVVRGADIAAQQALWTEARKNVANILDNARKTMDAIAEGGSLSWKETLTVVGTAAKGVGIFATGGLSVAIEVASLGIEVLSDAAGEDSAEKDVPSGGYNDAMGGLESTLKALNTQITTEEERVNENLTTNMANIRNDKTSYDLTQPPISSSDGVIVLTRSLVDEITNSYMPAIATELEAIASIGLDCSTYSAVSRDGAIGIGQSGPSGNISELNWLLFELVKSLGEEVRLGARNLELAVASLEHYDQTTADELADIAKKVEDGSVYDPWNVPEERFRGGHI